MRARFALLFAFVSVGHAEPRELAWDIEIDGPLTLAGMTAWVETEFVKGTIGPTACKWCATNDFDLSARRSFVWSDTNTAQGLSDAFAFAIVPTLVTGTQLLVARHDSDWKHWLVDMLIIAECGVASADLNQAVKYFAARERPYTLAPGFEGNRGVDQHVSFFSGHSALLFALATSAGTVATMRGYRWAPLVWAVGLPGAFVGSYMRMAADAHWMTDILVGAGLGAVLGVGIPLLAHRPIKVVPHGAGLGVAGTF